MKLHVLLSLCAVALLSSPTFAEQCKNVKGRITSTIVGEFSDGSPCTSPAGVCTEGRFTGRLKGKFRFTAFTLTPFNALDPLAPADVAATTGSIALESKACDGILVMDDTATFSLSADGSVASLETPNQDMSSGNCAGITGRLRISGVFEGGCVDCRYKGSLCGLPKKGSDDVD